MQTFNGDELSLLREYIYIYREREREREGENCEWKEEKYE
jgi:hypothetical protein